MTDPAKYYYNNVEGTLHLLIAMHEAGVDNLVFSSTAAVYGEPEKTPIEEDFPTVPTNVYGRTKLQIETMMKDFAMAYEMKYVALRYFNAAGADLDGTIGEDHSPETHLIPLILKTAQGVRDHISIFGTDYPTADARACGTTSTSWTSPKPISWPCVTCCREGKAAPSTWAARRAFPSGKSSTRPRK